MYVCSCRMSYVEDSNYDISVRPSLVSLVWKCKCPNQTTEITYSLVRSCPSLTLP